MVDTNDAGSTRPAPTRWIAALIATVTVAALVTVGVAVLRPNGPPVIRLAGAMGAPAGAATSEAMDDGARADLAIWNPVEHRFVLADSARFEAGEAAAWQLRPPSDLRSAANALAQRFGLGDVAPSPWDDASLHAGAIDGSGPNLWVGPTGEWFYNAPGPQGIWECSAAGSTGSEDGTDDVLDDPADEDCVAPTPPTGVPTASEARGLAERLFAGFDLPGEVIIQDATADEWGAWVYGSIPVGGVQSDLFVSASWGADAELVSVSGTFASVERMGDYPTLDAEAAVARLQEQSLAWAARSGVEPLELIDEAVDTTSLPAPDGELEVVTVTLVASEPILTFHLDVDGALWLVPGYRFTDSEGGQWQVLAVDDGYVESEEPEVEEPAVEEPPVEEPAVEEPAVEEPPVEEPAVEEPAVEEPEVVEPEAGGTDGG
jgi:hypothetical protein